LEKLRLYTRLYIYTLAAASSNRGVVDWTLFDVITDGVSKGCSSSSSRLTKLAPKNGKVLRNVDLSQNHNNVMEDDTEIWMWLDRSCWNSHNVQSHLTTMGSCTQVWNWKLPQENSTNVERGLFSGTLSSLYFVPCYHTIFTYERHTWPYFMLQKSMSLDSLQLNQRESCPNEL